MNTWLKGRHVRKSFRFLGKMRQVAQELDKVKYSQGGSERFKLIGPGNGTQRRCAFG